MPMDWAPTDAPVPSSTPMDWSPHCPAPGLRAPSLNDSNCNIPWQHRTAPQHSTPLATPNLQRVQLLFSPPGHNHHRAWPQPPSLARPTAPPTRRTTRQTNRLRRQRRQAQHENNGGIHTASTPQSAQQRPPGIKLATYNMQDGRNSRLQLLAFNLGTQNIDLCLATETRMHTEKHSKHFEGYDIFCTITKKTNQGGIALLTRARSNWHLESTQVHSPNVLSTILVSGTQRTPIIGVYLPPSTLEDLPALTIALSRFPAHKPLLLGDLNVDLSNQETPRATQVATLLSSFGLFDMLPHYRQRKPFRHQKTWHQYRQDLQRTIRSCCDYILGTVVDCLSMSASVNLATSPPTTTC